MPAWLPTRSDLTLKLNSDKIIGIIPGAVSSYRWLFRICACNPITAAEQSPLPSIPLSVPYSVPSMIWTPRRLGVSLFKCSGSPMQAEASSLFSVFRTPENQAFVFLGSWALNRSIKLATPSGVQPNGFQIWARHSISASLIWEVSWKGVSCSLATLSRGETRFCWGCCQSWYTSFHSGASELWTFWPNITINRSSWGSIIFRGIKTSSGNLSLCSWFAKSSLTTFAVHTALTTTLRLPRSWVALCWNREKSCSSCEKRFTSLRTLKYPLPSERA